MLISVIIPAYNCSETIERCISSVIAQTYKNLEIILINDGSSDNTHEVCERIAKTDSRIKYYSQSNKGVSFTRNKGISYAQGDLVTFVDSDDFIIEDMYSQMVDALVRKNTDVCVCSYNNVVDNVINKIKLPFDKDYLNRKDILSEYLPLLIGESDNASLIGSCCVCLYRKELLNNLSFSEEIELQEDTIFNIEVFRKASSVALVNKQLYNYCYNPSSATNRYRENVLEQIDLLDKKFSQYVSYLNDCNVDCKQNFVNTVHKWFLFLIKNLNCKNSPYSNKQKVDCLKNLFKRDSFKNYLRYYKAKTIKQKVFIATLKLKLYPLIIRIMKG